MLFMLVDTPDPRYGGGFDPDAERERRWRPASWRQVVPAAGSISCFAIAPGVGGPFTSWVLMIGGVALCAQFARVSLREDPPRRNRPLPASDDGD
jgi:hypothetical protein